jgi:hypothetical protein
VEGREAGEPPILEERGRVIRCPYPFWAEHMP